MKNIQSAFVNLLDILEALPDRVPDDTPLAKLMPGVWPTMRDLRDLCARANIVRKP